MRNNLVTEVSAGAVKPTTTDDIFTDAVSPLLTPDLALSVRDLTKIYKLYNSPQDRLKEALHPLRKKYHHEFYALNNVSFDIKKGETVGIVGKNGSGKSTLLKAVSGVLTPSRGSVAIDGKISALLELGAGFNPQLTGIENVYFNGTIVGYTKEQIDEKVDAILSFADIGEFINQPVKTYSSGMFVRLAFAVAINIDPEILIIDEALAVGDNIFKSKCYKKFKEFQDSGHTILFCSHSLESIIHYCNRALVLNEGKKIADTSAKDAVDIYKKLIVGSYTDEQDLEDSPTPHETKIADYKSFFLANPAASIYGNRNAEIIDYGIIDETGNPSSKLYFDSVFTIIMQIKFDDTISDPIFAYIIRDLKGLEITGTNSLLKNTITGTFNKGDSVTVTFSQKANLRSGIYSLCLGCTGYAGEDLTVYNRLYDIILFEVISKTKQASVGFFDMHSSISIQSRQDT